MASQKEDQQLASLSKASSSQQSYASVTAFKSRPSKEDAIVIDSIESLTNDDYVDGLETLIDVKDIRYMSKISGKRIIVYLSSKNLVQTLKNKIITVKNHAVRIKPYISSNKRVVISNVQPMIPDHLIIDLLKREGKDIVSQITDIRASFIKPGRSHIISLRRQFYVKEEDENKLPEKLQINFDNTTYWTYLTTESTLCFLCKQTGHTAKLCTKNDLIISK